MKYSELFFFHYQDSGILTILDESQNDISQFINKIKNNIADLDFLGIDFENKTFKICHSEADVLYSMEKILGFVYFNI